MNRHHLPSLLLLPYPPQPPTRVALDAAYRPTLAAAISKSKNATRGTILIVAVASPILRGLSPTAKSLSWAEAQSLLAGLYSIVSVICAQQSIGNDVDGGPGSIDVRIVLVDHDRNRRFTADRQAFEPNNTIIVDLPTFAAAYHPWNFIYHANCEAGYEVLSTYLKFAEGAQKLFQSQLVVLEGGVTLNVESLTKDRPAASPAYANVCLGGTFDHLHAGHKLLLTAASILLQVPRNEAAEPCLLVVGVSGDGLLKNKKYAEYLQSWEVRSRAVLHFLWSILELSTSGWKGNMGPRIDEQPGDFRAAFRNGAISVQCVEFQDPCGPTITMPELEALALSTETRAGGPPINEKRTEQGWKPLEIYEVDVLDVEEITEGSEKSNDFAAKISSTEIRRLKAERGSK